MAQQLITIGTTPGDNTGDPARTAFDKANDNFTELYGDVGTLQTDVSVAQGDISALQAAFVLVTDYGAVGDGSTDNSAAIQAAIDALEAAGGGVLYIPKGNYRCNSALTIQGSNITIYGQGRFSRIMFYTAASVDCLTIGPVNATTPATTEISGIQIFDVVFWYVNANSTAAVVRMQKCTSCTFSNVAFWGGFYNVLLEGARNCTFLNCTTSSVNFVGLTGSANIKITALTQSDSSLYHGFTVRFFGGIFSGAVYDATWHIEDNDYTLLSGLYSGATKTHVLLKPASDNNYIYNTELADTYLDGVSVSNTTYGIVVDGNGTTNAIVHLTRVIGGIMAQLTRAVWIKNNITKVSHFELSGVDIHNIKDTPIYANCVSNSNLVLVVTGTTISNYGKEAATPGNVYSVYAVNANTVNISNCVTSGYTAGVRGFYATNIEFLTVAHNTLKFLLADSGLAWSTITTAVFKGNVGDVNIRDRNTAQIGSWTPDLAFGGASTGITYSNRSGLWYEIDQLVFFTVYVSLSSKGSATGAATITLPFNPAVVNGTYSYSASKDNTTVIAAYNLPNDSATPGIRLSLSDSDFANNTKITVNGFFKR